MDDTVDIVHEDETELIEVSGRGRPRRVPERKFLGECICGNPVSAEEMDDGGQAIICKRAGCETTWYHLECVGLERRIPAWVCESCKSSGGKGQGGKRRRDA
ncbi:hypothetical protein GALMADRAFT_76123 [Galerina marginata CBS 339.88]|uniref:Zinc finger PHD-type domain-containing protein n=1 Tax=Galerina marginata (strain CBS 339.88) TaxID=685588 RepID=A0A067SS73_GALM3|nr:hypothetical protein GALMADRAFT_76123 [Galerina marginata CBS 339.88]